MSEWNNSHQINYAVPIIIFNLFKFQPLTINFCKLNCLQSFCTGWRSLNSQNEVLLLIIIDCGHILKNISPRNKEILRFTKDYKGDNNRWASVYNVQTKLCRHKHYQAAIAHRRLTLYLWFCIKSSNNGRWGENGKCVHVVCLLFVFYYFPFSFFIIVWVLMLLCSAECRQRLFTVSSIWANGTLNGNYHNDK